jgi:ribosomal protein S18 acetylase RimI-like enzyme
MPQLQLPTGYEIRRMTGDEFAPLFSSNREKMFGDTLTFFTNEALSEQERDALSRLSKNMGQPFMLRLGLFYEGNFIGWSFGRQDGHERFYMVNSAIFPEHRSKGLYRALMHQMVDEVSKEGFQIIYSRHNATNSAILIPKLKYGFVISAMELSDTFGLLVHLSFFTNPIRRKVMDVRAGELRPDEELKKYFRL